MRVLVALGIFTLAGCGSAEETATIAGTTYTNEADGTATISSERGSVSASDGKAAANTPMPDFAPQYPGSTIESALMSERDGTQRTTVVFATDDSVKQVADFYREKFAAAGLTVKNTLMTDEAGILSAEGGGRKASVTISQDEGLNKGTVTFTGA